MKMDSNNSDHSPPLSDNPGESWMAHMACWENDDSSVSGLNLGSDGLHELVEDKEVAARAVAFVVSSTRKGIVPLCADVANLLRSKKMLEKKVDRLKSENESLRSSRAGSIRNSDSTSPPASVNSYSDRGSQLHERSSSRPCSRCSSHCSSLVSNSPKFDKNRHQRSPQSFQQITSARRLSNDHANGNHINSNHQVTLALVHSNSQESPPVGNLGYNSQERKRSLPQIVSEPHSSVPKVSPHSQKVSVGMQCSLLSPDAARDSRLEEQFRETVRLNSSLAEDLGAAKKEIEILKASLKELEMKQLAQQCLEECQVSHFTSPSSSSSSSSSSPPPSSSTSNSKEAPFVVPVLQRGDSVRKRNSPRPTSSPILIPCPLDGCCCANCKDLPVTRSTLVIPPKNGVSNNISGRLQLELGDHVVVRGERTGHVMYIGHLDHFTPSDAIFIGLELDAPVGRHDGAVNGNRYFQCQKDHGAFVPMQDILCIIAKQTRVEQTQELSTVTIEVEDIALEKKSEKKEINYSSQSKERDKTRIIHNDDLTILRDHMDLV